MMFCMARPSKPCDQLLTWHGGAATWMLEISTVSAEERMGRDFADIFQQSGLAK